MSKGISENASTSGSAAQPTRYELEKVLRRISQRVARLLERQGLLGGATGILRISSGASNIVHGAKRSRAIISRIDIRSQEHR